MRRRNGSTRTMMLLLLATVVLGIYALPSAIAKFSGSHTWEIATGSNRVAQLKCTKCHYYIESEINAAENGNVTNAATLHKNAAGATNYINTSGAPLNFTNPGNSTLSRVCLMCHEVEQGSGVTGTHTKITIRVCTDIDCHGQQGGVGDNSTTNASSCSQVWDENHCNVTGRINNSADAHYNFYRPLEKDYASPYGNENGGNYRYGFISCMACHTHLGFNKRMVRPQKLETYWNWSSTDLLTANMQLVNVTLNTSGQYMNGTEGGKLPGSAWN